MSTRLTVERLMKATFDTPRDPRSDAYKAGTRALFAKRLKGIALTCPFAPGTAQNDAFYAGVDEGNAVLRGRELPAVPTAKSTP